MQILLQDSGALVVVRFLWQNSFRSMSVFFRFSFSSFFTLAQLVFTLETLCAETQRV